MRVERKDSRCHLPRDRSRRDSELPVRRREKAAAAPGGAVPGSHPHGHGFRSAVSSFPRRPGFPAQGEAVGRSETDEVSIHNAVFLLFADPARRLLSTPEHSGIIRGGVIQAENKVRNAVERSCVGLAAGRYRSPAGLRFRTYAPRNARTAGSPAGDALHARSAQPAERRIDDPQAAGPNPAAGPGF